MEILLLILFGFLSGILGGMGMGGGTLLIPLLSFLDMTQHTIQAINLISFLPMAIVALIVHSRNGLVCKNKVLYMIIPAVLLATAGSLLTKCVSQSLLRICFGVLLLAIGVWQFILAIKQLVKSGNSNKKTNISS